MKSLPVWKHPPPTTAYLFPLPLNQADIFRAGSSEYQDRWFGSEVCVPTGIWSWVDKRILRPYAERLVECLYIGGNFDVNLVIANGRYVLDGPNLEEAPSRIQLPICPPISLTEALHGIATRLPGKENEVLRWLEFFQSHLPHFAEILRAHPKLQDLMR